MSAVYFILQQNYNTAINYALQAFKTNNAFALGFHSIQYLR